MLLELDRFLFLLLALLDLAHAQGTRINGIAILLEPSTDIDLTAGSNLAIAIDVSKNGELPPSNSVPGSEERTGIDSLELYLTSRAAQQNFTISRGSGLLVQEPDSKIKHLSWFIPPCINTGVVSLSIIEGAYINNISQFTVTDIAFLVFNAAYTNDCGGADQNPYTGPTGPGKSKEVLSDTASPSASLSLPPESPKPSLDPFTIDGSHGLIPPPDPTPSSPDQVERPLPIDSSAGNPAGNPTSNPIGSPTGNPAGDPTDNPTSSPTGEPAGGESAAKSRGSADNTSYSEPELTSHLSTTTAHPKAPAKDEEAVVTATAIIIKPQPVDSDPPVIVGNDGQATLIPEGGGEGGNLPQAKTTESGGRAAKTAISVGTVHSFIPINSAAALVPSLITTFLFLSLLKLL